jgi:hypothetical protein
MFDLGLNLTMQAVGRQLAAMPHDLYLVRLIHGQTRRAFPGERLWTAAQLTYPATLRFLRARNREGCDVYLQPYSPGCNPGYVLVDLDHNSPAILEVMRNNGHEPCVVLQTSPGNLQTWVRVSDGPIEPAIASVVGKLLAHTYGGDLASTDWRHLGRLAGFTNKKPHRRDMRGYCPWVKVWHAHAGLASQGAALLQQAELCLAGSGNMALPSRGVPPDEPGNAVDARLAGRKPTTGASRIYGAWLHRLRILERFPQPDWSIADKWIAKELLGRGTPAPQVAAILRDGSPGFPRRHSRPDDYLRRTIARAAFELQPRPFPGRESLPQPAD